jgi:hypothetical protein
MSEHEGAKRIWANPAARIIIIAAGALVLGIVIGFVPAWVMGQRQAKEFANARQELELNVLQNLLGSAAVGARRGNYEPARQEVSEFFTRLRTEADRGEKSALNAGQRERVTPLFDQRDNIITLLARGDPASAERLSDLYVEYRKAMEGK